MQTRSNQNSQSKQSKLKEGANENLEKKQEDYPTRGKMRSTKSRLELSFESDCLRKCCVFLDQSPSDVEPIKAMPFCFGHSCQYFTEVLISSTRRKYRSNKTLPSRCDFERLAS